jgi:hypothetical protein
VPFHSSLQLHAGAVTGGKEVRTDKKEYYICAIKVLIYLVLPLCARADVAVVPITDHTVGSQYAKMLFKFVAKVLILMCI